MSKGGKVKMFEVQQYNRISFSTHNEMMKEFRRLHGRVATVKPTRAAEHDLIAITAPLAIRCVNADSGGLSSTERNANLSTSLSLPKVANYKLSSN